MQKAKIEVIQRNNNQSTKAGKVHTVRKKHSYLSIRVNEAGGREQLKYRLNFTENVFSHIFLSLFTGLTTEVPEARHLN